MFTEKPSGKETIFSNNLTKKLQKSILLSSFCFTNLLNDFTVVIYYGKYPLNKLKVIVTVQLVLALCKSIIRILSQSTRRVQVTQSLHALHYPDLNCSHTLIMSFSKLNNVSKMIFNLVHCAIIIIRIMNFIIFEIVYFDLRPLLSQHI